MHASFSFVDLFCGIGGFHVACASLGGRCAMACDKDPAAREIYKANFGIEPHDDIRTMPVIPNIDLLCAGPPCQAFSTIGRQRGTEDPRGGLFYELVRYIARSRPRMFLIENVKGLTSTRYEQTFGTILRRLRAAGYAVSFQVLDASRFGVPQHRERVYLMGVRGEGPPPPLLPEPPHGLVPLSRVLDRNPDPALRTSRMDPFVLPAPIHTATGFVIIAQKNEYTDKRVFGRDGIIGTLQASGPPLIHDGTAIRNLSIAELRRIQGFPATFRSPGSRTEAGKRFGNAVCVPVVRALVRHLLPSAPGHIIYASG